MTNTCLYADQIKYSIREQRNILVNAGRYGYIDNTKTAPHEFIQIGRYVDVLIVDSGVVLHNLAIRSAINKLAARPLLLWMQSVTQDSANYVLGETVEAGLSGSDGIILKPSELASEDDACASIRRCRDHGLSSVIQVEKQTDVNAILSLETKPDAIVTFNNFDIKLPDDFGIHHINISKYPAQSGSILYSELDQIPPPTPTSHQNVSSPLVKVCGIKTVDAAKVALDSGADMIGMILVPGRARTVDMETAKRISQMVRGYNRKQIYDPPRSVNTAESVFEATSQLLRIKTAKRPYIVGVFRNQSLQTILEIQEELQLDMVQLHGSEPLSWCHLIPVPVIKRFTPNTQDFESCSITGYHKACLLDGEIGGEGKLVDWSATQGQVKLGARFVLAGGLNEHNVADALKTEGVFGVDVSGGVESSEGIKDLKKIERFVRNAKSTPVNF
jgi:phosphoribosylanthranilate isomerase